MTAAQTTTATEREPRRREVGIVTSAARNKTVAVRIDRLVKWPKYGKYLRRRTRVHVHDEKNDAKVGDLVEIMECRPISRTKSWRLVRILRSSGEGA
ncbi:MAG: 30S ribosomal protein S17 [Phycisphaerae bacterium]|nr:30S ribosomal protein S17 [Phycisphaerae bacterium]